MLVAKRSHKGIREDIARVLEPLLGKPFELVSLRNHAKQSNTSLHAKIPSMSTGTPLTEAEFEQLKDLFLIEGAPGNEVDGRMLERYLA